MPGIRKPKVPQPKRGLSVEVQLKGLKETQKAFDEIVQGLQGKKLTSAIGKAAMLVVRSARKNAPVDTGRLRASIVPEIRVRDKLIMGIVGSNVKYAPYQEMGTSAFTPPMSALMRWAMRKERGNIKAARGLAGGAWVAIRKSGIKAKEFIQKAIAEHADTIKRIVFNAVDQIAKGR